MPRFKNSCGVHHPKYKKSALLASLAQRLSAFTSMCGTDTAGRGALERPPEDSARTKVFDREFQFQESHTPLPADVICVSRSRKNGFEPIYIRLTCRPSTLEMRNISTAPNSILLKDELERSTTGITRVLRVSIHPRSRRGAQRIRKGEGRWSRPPKTFTRWSRPPKTFTCFIRSSPADVKQNKRSSLCHRKIQNINNYRLELLPILEIIESLRTSRYNQNLKDSSSTCGIFATSRLSRSASVRVHVEVRNGYGTARGV